MTQHIAPARHLRKLLSSYVSIGSHMTARQGIPAAAKFCLIVKDLAAALERSDLCLLAWNKTSTESFCKHVI